MKVFQNMSKCDRLVSEACDIKLSTNESSDVAKCNKVMGEFRENADACIKTPTNCSCWNSLVKDIKSVKDCNIGRLKFCMFSGFISQILFSWGKGKGH